MKTFKSPPGFSARLQVFPLRDDMDLWMGKKIWGSGDEETIPCISMEEIMNQGWIIETFTDPKGEEK